MAYASEPHSRPRGHWATTILAVVVALLGLPLLGLGAWLIVLGGSWYYGLAGLGLIIVAVLLAQRSMAAIWLYLLVWLGTLGWAYWEVGTDWWAQVPRVVAPTVLFVIILLFTPLLGRRTREGAL
ncbi:glucose dehydrogenase [Acuticoccus sediminis]|uniref:Glucose dehydrogenase n=1 Tax=Acuticoccus sediminis TaxID=2184697 RepID=A0A8B2NZ02_9HYPH|nr:glucose dehydrogenase [Acuticoccus sediminis]RAI03385.1 glucose dehydrogenase [Acuticoccus sediminis]